MSFVLDALKLSEKRRSRFARPVYAHPPPARQAGRRRRWIAVFAAAPIIAGVFLTWRLIAPPSPVSFTAPADNAGISAAMESSATRLGPPPAPADGREEHGETDPATPGVGLSGSISEQHTSPEASIPTVAAGTATAPQSPPPAEGLPLETAPTDWPALTLQMLFFSPESDRSFVQINGRNYRVGESLDAGPEVLEIASHGVILTYRGKQVLLPMDR